MLKIRVMGDTEDIQWFKESLMESQVIELIDFSDVFPCGNTNKYYRAYGQVIKKHNGYAENK